MPKGSPSEKAYLVQVGNQSVMVLAQTKPQAIAAATATLGINARLASHHEILAAGKTGQVIINAKEVSSDAPE